VNETIFFQPSVASDYREPHSWMTLANERFCLGRLADCPFCNERFQQPGELNE
jgi:hypothetical protein